jgi:large subunit ribosomal protein L17
MPQPKKAARFGGAPAHHNMILANLTTELIRHGRIRTTHAKAKAMQPLAERMVTFAKRGDVHSRRQVLRVVRDKDVVHKLFATVGPAFAERNGGYTRVLRLEPRKGDAAPMALIEFVEGVEAVGEGSLEEAPRRRWSLRRRRGSLSASGRERAEERAAAMDRGEAPRVYEDEHDHDHDHEAEDMLSAPAAPADEDEIGIRPEDVEARLAAEDEADAEADADEADADAADTEPDEDQDKA